MYNPNNRLKKNTDKKIVLPQKPNFSNGALSCGPGKHVFNPLGNLKLIQKMFFSKNPPFLKEPLHVGLKHIVSPTDNNR